MQTIVPLYDRFLSKYEKVLKKTPPKPRELKHGMAEFTKALDSCAYEYWKLLEEKGYLDLDASETKMPNMGCQRFVEKWNAGPLLINPTSNFSDGWVIVHEFGHSFQEKLAYEKQNSDLAVIASVDLMEISSRAMELLLYERSDCLYQDSDLFKIHHMKSLLHSLCMFAFGTIYENWLYHNIDTDASRRTASYIQLYRTYFHVTDELTDEDIRVKLYDDSLIYTMPKYQYSYIPGWIHAVELAADDKKDHNFVWTQYCEISRDLAFYTYPDLLTKYHLHNIYEPDSLDRFIKLLNQLLPI